MPVFYDPLVVLLSVLVAIQGAVVSLALIHASRAAVALRRRLLVAAAAAVMGAGIWAMHFIGMLALHLPVALAYDPLPTLVSGLVCILVTWLGFHLVASGAPGPRPILLGGAVMGLGIGAMHYLGMSALRGQCLVTWSAPLVIASVVLGVGAAMAALWLAFRPHRKTLVQASAVVLGLGVALIHYTGMAAASFLPAGDLLPVADPLLDQGALALVVAVAAFVISGVFLLTVLPDRTASVPQAAPDAPSPARTPERRVAVQQRGATLLLDPAEIRAIQAEGHYTRVNDGRGSYLCPQSITVLCGHLDPTHFLRVHRSHIVNRRWIRGFRRDGDQGVVIVDGEPRLEVPVSRNNVRRIRDTLLEAA